MAKSAATAALPIEITRQIFKDRCNDADKLETSVNELFAFCNSEFEICNSVSDIPKAVSDSCKAILSLSICLLCEEKSAFSCCKFPVKLRDALIAARKESSEEADSAAEIPVDPAENQSNHQHKSNRRLELTFHDPLPFGRR